MGRDQLTRELILFRFYVRRLSFLTSPDELTSIRSGLSNHEELYLQSKVMEAIESQDVSTLIKLGNNAVQAAAQILQIQGNYVTCDLRSFKEVELQGLAILRLNGIKIQFSKNTESHTKHDPLNQFALNLNSAQLMQSEDLFIQEIACLRGLNHPLEPIDLLNSAFDRYENISFDMIDQLEVSSYF